MPTLRKCSVLFNTKQTSVFFPSKHCWNCIHNSFYHLKKMYFLMFATLKSGTLEHGGETLWTAVGFARRRWRALCRTVLIHASKRNQLFFEFKEVFTVTWFILILKIPLTLLQIIQWEMQHRCRLISDFYSHLIFLQSQNRLQVETRGGIPEGSGIEIIYLSKN